MSTRGGFLVVASLAGVLAAAALACEGGALQPRGGAGGNGWSSLPSARDAGADDSKKPDGDSSPDHYPLDVTSAPVGAACTGSAACASGFCVDGICCASACAGGCQTCVAPDAVGTCIFRAAGELPRRPDDCPSDSPASCGLDGTCDGAGACRLYRGNECLSGVCADGVITGSSLCDGQGDCRPGVTVDCIPFACDPVTNECKAMCQSDDDCLGGHSCHNGTCQGPSREPCLNNEDCASGFCTDGVCCNTACPGPCVSCALAGHLGTCTPIAAGMKDPRAICVDQGAASCGHDGSCDGRGGCNLYPAGVSCGASSCSGTLWSGNGTCTGTGTCRRDTIPCLPYACDPQTNACHFACGTADDCAAGTPCVNGACGEPQPASCSTNLECASGFCAQGACCTTSCGGPCFSCALPGTIGTCTRVSDPPDAGACGS